MSPCGVVPLFGTEPRLGENERLSEVRFSSRMLSPGGRGKGSGVGVAVLLGRKIVLKPLPTQSPTNAASGPRGAGGAVGPAILCSGRSSPNTKSKGSLMDALGFVSLIRQSFSWERVNSRKGVNSRSVPLQGHEHSCHGHREVMSRSYESDRMRSGINGQASGDGRFTRRPGGADTSDGRGSRSRAARHNRRSRRVGKEPSAAGRATVARAGRGEKAGL